MDYGALGLAVRNEVVEYFGRHSCINAEFGSSQMLKSLEA